MTVHYGADGSIVVITIDRPEVCNAIDGPTVRTLADAMHRFDEDPGLSVAHPDRCGRQVLCWR